jgi:hypothetical protein
VVGPGAACYKNTRSDCCAPKIGKQNVLNSTGLFIIHNRILIIQVKNKCIDIIKLYKLMKNLKITLVLINLVGGWVV